MTVHLHEGNDESDEEGDAEGAGPPTPSSVHPVRRPVNYTRATTTSSVPKVARTGSSLGGGCKSVASMSVKEMLLNYGPASSRPHQVMTRSYSTPIARLSRDPYRNNTYYGNNKEPKPFFDNHRNHDNNHRNQSFLSPYYHARGIPGLDSLLYIHPSSYSRDTYEYPFEARQQPRPVDTGTAS
jgi:hypothetical protein